LNNGLPGFLGGISNRGYHANPRYDNTAIHY
jgi:hypothetical protein